ncbi:YciI family protein [Hoeflea sp.]|uniref:YciI family protein n=1 Tax=Hoeflea sp. TaxID=1940281 RepID=UPI003B01DA55
MPNFVFAYHGGKPPESPEEGAKVMAAWNAWFETMGSAVVDGGAPVGASKTVAAGGVTDGGGANPLSGYSIVSADTIDAAVDMAKGCPILEGGGNVEVAEAMEM